MASNSSSIITGMNPMAYNSANPIPLFIIQLLIIIFLCRFLHIFLSRLLQPRVIAEIIAGIILGPTVLGRWKAFNDNVFPKSSLTVLNLVSNIGLILFLFMVGLELDPKMLKRNIHKSIMISVAGIVLPFALGIATSYGLFKLLHQSGSFVIFMLFCGVAMGITAFPVLARILTELNLLKTTVGSISISAAAVDDVVSWCLLALVVALTNNASGLSALWVFLVGLGWTLFILMVVRPVYIWYLHRKGCLEPNREPPQHVIFLTFAMIFISAWFTDVIGIHAIFGGFLIGIIVPHSGGFAIKIIEKIEDLVVIFFLPIYFALSGLKTNLSDLNDGVTWGLLILIIFVAFIGKIIGCTLAARLNKFNWRESLTIGFLMNCKGLVELIVLNIGLDAGVINNKIFTMMVVKALVTTFVTTPVVAWLYPPKHQRRIEDDDAFDETKSVFSRYHGFEAGLPMNVFVVVNKIRHVPALVTLVDYLHHRPGLDGAGWPDSGSRRVAELGSYMYRPLQVFVLRLMELTSRESSVMRHAESEFFIRTDPILSMFRAFARVAHLVLRSSLLVTEPEQFGANIVLSAEQAKAHIIILQAYGQGSATISPDSGRVSSSVHTPWYEAIIGRTGGGNGDDDYQQYYTTAQQTAMVMSVFDNAKAVVAVFVDRGLGEDDSHYHHHCSMQQQQQQQQSAWGARGSRSDSADNYEKQSTRMARPSSFDSRDFDLGKDSLAMVPTYQVNDFSLDPTDQPLPPSRAHTDTPLIVLPFFGGPDDRQALRLVCDLCTHAGVRVLIIHYVKTTQPTDRDVVLSASDFPERPVIPATPAVHRSALAREETNPWDAVQQPEVRQF
ncbi:K(+)/H(+) antiporter, partial [Spiromyces aspiralis]